MHYWKTHQKDIILKHLTAVAKNQLEFRVWQQFGEHRHSYTGSFSILTRKSCKIKIKDVDKIQFFDREAPFYVHITDVDIIFKKDNYNMHGALLEFSLPNDIQVHERRRTKRFSYKYQDHKNITYHSAEKDPKSGEPKFTMSSVLVDISTMGAGMVVGRDQIDLFHEGQDLLLDNLTDQELPTPFHVKVKYIEQYNLKEKQFYKIGLMFDDELNSISYKSISSIIEIKQRKVAGLSQEQYCGIDDEEQVNAINRIEASNQVLASNIKDNIEYLDQLRYMTTHMKVDFLKMVNQDLLAIALRLSSKELIYDLFSEVTETMQEEFLFKLKNERPPSAICKAQDEVIKFIRDKEKNGEIVLDPKAFVTYV